MSLFGNLFSAVAKVALTPITIIADVADMSEGEAPVNTVGNLLSAGKDTLKGAGDLLSGDIIDDDEDLGVDWE